MSAVKAFAGFSLLLSPVLTALFAFMLLDLSFLRHRGSPRSWFPLLYISVLCFPVVLVIEFLLQFVGPTLGTVIGALYDGFVVAAPVEELGKWVCIHYLD